MALRLLPIDVTRLKGFVMALRRTAALVLALATLCGLAGCYQVHSDDDLRTIPVTNNPNIVPRSPSQGIPSPKI